MPITVPTIEEFNALAASIGAPTSDDAPPIVAKPAFTATRYSGNPPIPQDGFDAGSQRDGHLIHARGQLWLFYTGAESASSPYNPSIGLASSLDGKTWVRHGKVCDGFSPCAWHDPVTDTLYLYTSETALPEQWYSGPITIAMVTVQGDWTDPANYTRVGPLLAQDQAWEGTQGVYAPSVLRLAGKFVMLYSSGNNGGGNWNIGRAVADSPAGPFVKQGLVIPGVEEPSMLVLPGGTLVCLTDDLSAAGGPYGVGLWACATQDGLGAWTREATLLGTDAQAFDASVIGSSSAALMPDGSVALAYNGKPAGASDARRIGIATGLVRLNVEQPVQPTQQTGGSGSIVAVRERDDVIVNPAPVVDTLVPGLSITIAAAASPRVALVNFAVSFKAAHPMRAKLYLDGVQEFPDSAPTGGGFPAALCEAANGNEEWFMGACVALTIPGDSQAHTVELRWNAVASTAAVTLRDRSMAIQY